VIHYPFPDSQLVYLFRMFLDELFHRLPTSTLWSCLQLDHLCVFDKESFNFKSFNSPNNFFANSYVFFLLPSFVPKGTQDFRKCRYSMHIVNFLTSSPILIHKPILICFQYKIFPISVSTIVATRLDQCWF
jgi:hypothetical protein